MREIIEKRHSDAVPLMIETPYFWGATWSYFPIMTVVKKDTLFG
jgi:hypothetical protein